MYRDFIRYIEKLAPETDDDDDDKIGFPVDRSELFRHIAAFTAYLVVNATPGSLVKEDEYRITIHDCQRSIISWMYWYWDAFHPSTPKPDRAELSRIMQIGLMPAWDKIKEQAPLGTGIDDLYIVYVVE